MSKRAYPCAYCAHVAETPTEHMMHVGDDHSDARRGDSTRPVSCWRCAKDCAVVNGTIQRCSCGWQHPGWAATA